MLALLPSWVEVQEGGQSHTQSLQLADESFQWKLDKKEKPLKHAKEEKSQLQSGLREMTKELTQTTSLSAISYRQRVDVDWIFGSNPTPLLSYCELELSGFGESLDSS